MSGIVLGARVRGRAGSGTAPDLKSPVANDLGSSAGFALETVTTIAGRPSRKHQGGNMFTDVSKTRVAPREVTAQCSRMTQTTHYSACNYGLGRKLQLPGFPLFTVSAEASSGRACNSRNRTRRSNWKRCSGTSCTTSQA
jgi:hypothetical protein